jgi:acetyl esterase/lipase
MQKPSTLWPPPSTEMTSRVHASLRSRIRQTLRMDDTRPESPTVRPISTDTGMPVNVGATAPLPPLHSPDNQTISLIATSGETLTINQQVHFYAQNSLLAHPLISPAFSYLGGLPPLFFIASNGEVLRDEIIYTCVGSALSSGT